MICILHGYLLEGSGSNLWTRSIIQSLCRQGKTVHLVCQENHPEIYDFISTVVYYHEDGSMETGLERETPYHGQCIMHKPYIGRTLPVYVWDRYEEFSDVQPMIRLSDEKISKYVENNVRVLTHIVKNYGVNAIHANHAVLMSVVAQRMYDELGIPYAVMPHGSALEYTVKKDPRFFKMASQAFEKAELIFVIGKEIRNRVTAMFPLIHGLETKMTDLNLGVDTDLFRPIPRMQREQHIKALYEALADVPRGRTTLMRQMLEQKLFSEMTQNELMNAVRENSDYDPKNTDKDAETALSAINWRKDRVILYVGRLIAGKGIHLILAALPFIFQKHPDAKMVIVGHGPLREPLEAFIFALENGLRTLVENIVQWGSELGGAGKKPFREIQFYFEQLESDGLSDAYFEAAKNHIRKDRIVFTGYLKHRELRYLFPSCDVAIFPSIVAEAGPLVFLEAMASGCFPMGAYFAGMAASIDSVAGSIPAHVSELMKLRADEKYTVADIASNVQGALNIDEDSKAALRKIAVEKYDWQTVSKRLADYLMSVKL